MSNDEFTAYDAGYRVLVPGGGAWCLSVIAALRALRGPFGGMKYEQLHRCLRRAELGGDLSEFCAVSLHAILEMSEQSDFAIDYLEMAEAVAVSPYERAIASETRMAYDWLKASPPSVLDGVAATLAHDGHTAMLWNRLVVALSCLGEPTVIAAHGRPDTRAA